MKMQSNLSITDMLHRGHLLIAGTFSWNLLSYSQTLIKKAPIWRTLLLFIIIII